MLDRKEIDELAHLSRLVLSDDESEKMTEQINKLLNNFASLQKLDTENVPPTSHAVPTYNVFREDTVKPSLTPEEVVKNGPSAAENCFVVPRIVDTD
ncbi:MAG: Asp-tRNA(Asn)/Glu-tRNA(Gln) amidotransferase subunit GatC [Armatimonadetes bacterium]|nr:Asp-tRNA(Asn)/Glu-tRNA(Gln) amidotransferase subunit GatC [Candidatus Hippobium faecium]